MRCRLLLCACWASCAHWELALLLPPGWQQGRLVLRPSIQIYWTFNVTHQHLRKEEAAEP